MTYRNSFITIIMNLLASVIEIFECNHKFELELDNTLKRLTFPRKYFQIIITESRQAASDAKRLFQ